jgi:hypothetical protein
VALVVHECINYWGHVGNAGYGLDYEPKTQKTVLAHRKAYMDFFGAIEKGKVILHLCNNKKCVNPVHLKMGSQSENVKQSYRDGLQINPRRFLKTKEQVLEILNAEGTQRGIAKRFGTTQTVVKNIKQGRTYRDLTGGGTCGS